MPRLNTLVGLAICISLIVALTPAMAASTAADDPVAEVADIMAGVEGLVTQLALAEDLNSEEISALRVSLAELYRRLEGLEQMLAFMPVGPRLDPTQWQAYDKAELELKPEDAVFTGWNIDSGIDLGWGEYGEVRLDVQNSYYRATWTIKEAYTGEVMASVEAGSDGNLLLQIEDSEGSHEFRIENGGIGPLMIRWPENGGVEDSAEDESTTGGSGSSSSADSAWAQPYLALVDSGQIEKSATMDWFINQTKTRAYETDALRNLGEAVLSLTGQPKWNEPLGLMSYYVTDSRKEIHIPDPRSHPEGFSNVINKMYILTISEQVCTVEIH